MRDKPQIEAMYYLSPLQQGLLYHRLADAAADPYFYQYVYRLSGDLRLDAFERAWQLVVERHAVLRTAFVWEGVEKPLQVVRRQATLPIERHDWRGLPDEEQRLQFSSLLERDRAAGLDLLLPPLMRLHLIRKGDREWVLINSHHHILLDGWSMALVLRDVLAAYETLAGGASPSIESPRPYREYISWVHRQDLAQAETFWRATLAGFHHPTPIAIEAPFPEASAESLPFAEQSLRLPADRMEALQALAKRIKVTLNTLFQGAWALLLHRYSGEKDILFGATVSGRPAELAGVEAMVGLFINSLPIRVSVRPDQTLAEWLRDLQDRNAALRQYEWTPLSHIQRWSDVPNGRPLFESLLVFESYPEAPQGGEPSSLSIEPVTPGFGGGYRLTPGRNNYPLSLMVEPGRDLQLIVCYAHRRFAHETITRLFGHLDRLLAAMAATPEARVADLSLLTEEERTQLLAWNGSIRSDDAAESCIHDLIAAQVEARPDAMAVVTKTERLTYQELDRRATLLARYLRGQRVGPDDRIGLCLDRSLDLVIGILAVLKAGCAYVPLDPTYPRERLATMMADSQARWIITRSDQAQGLADFADRLVLLDRQADEIANCGDGPLAVPVSPKSLAYVIYTSGSTGRPKGVAVEHRQVAAYVRALLQLESVAAGASLAALSTVAADLGNTALFGALCSGRTLHLFSTEDGFDPDAMASAMQERGIEVLKIVPSHLRGLLHAARPEHVLPTRCLILGGEALRHDLVQEVRRLVPACSIVNHYGPTETTIGVLAHVLEDSAGHTERDVPIGRPFSSVQAHVLEAMGSRSRSACRENSISEGSRLRGAISDDPRRRRSDSFPIPSVVGREPGCTGRAIGRHGVPTAGSNFWAASTIRSRCAGSASSSGTSKRNCGASRTWPTRSRWFAKLPTARSSSWPTWSDPRRWIRPVSEPGSRCVFRTIWSRRPSCGLMPCPSRPMASSTEPPCLTPDGRTQPRCPHTWNRATRLRRSWREFGKPSCKSNASACTTTFSPWGAIRSARCRSLRAQTVTGSS